VKELNREDFHIAKIRTHEYIGINEVLYKFYIQDLISKSLLYDDGIGMLGVSSLKMIEITEFGISFLNYIETAKVEDIR